MEVLRIGNYLPSEFLADTNKKVFHFFKVKKVMSLIARCMQLTEYQSFPVQ